MDLQRGAPDTPAQKERLAYMLFKAGQYREAHSIYSELAAGSDNPDLQLNTAVSLALLGDDAAAAEAYRRVLEIAPGNRRALIYLGNSLLRMGHNGDAAQAYAESLSGNVEDEAAERIRRILLQIAPELIPEEEEGEPTS